jgi:hypothetical protein
MMCVPSVREERRVIATKPRRLWCAAAILLAASGCAGPVKPVPIVAIGSDFNCLSYPSAFRDSGVVFAVNKQDGGATTFKDLHATSGVVVNTAEFVDISASRKNTVNAGVLASLLGLPLKAGANADSVFAVSQTFGNASQTDVDQASTNLLVDAFYGSPELTRAIGSGDAARTSYYLVRNTIRALDVAYKFDRDIRADIDVGATAIPGVGAIEAKAGFDNVTGLSYDKTFKQPEDVCIQAVLLPVPRPRQPASVAAAVPAWRAGPGDQPLFKRFQVP